MPINPTSGQIAATVAVSQVDPILSGYVFASGIHNPEHSSYLSYRFPQYFLTSLLERIGRYKPIAQDQWSWNELDRTRKSATVSSITTSLPAASVVLTTDLADPGYFVPTDVVRDGTTGVMFRITATGSSGGFQTLTISKLVDASASITTSDLAATNKLGHAFNIQSEFSSAPSGRLYLPNQLDNSLNILRRSLTMSGSELTNRTYLADGKSWYFTQENIEDKEFARDREIAILLGKKITQSGSTLHAGDGLLSFISAGGTTNTYTGAVTESDIQDHVRDLMVQSESKEYTILCGADFMNGLQKAMRPYFIAGSVSYGTFAQASTIGLDVQTYKYLGRTLNFTHYQLFDDQAVFPYTGTASSTAINFSNYSLWLDMGQDSSGQDLISLKYKELAGNQRKLIKAIETGLMNPQGQNGGMVSNGKDGFTLHWLSDIGIEVRNAHYHGILRANG